jgi:diaminopimelate decarboxylase
MEEMIPLQLVSPDLILSDEVLSKGVSCYGTPLYIYDPSLMRKRWEDLTSVLPECAELFYSVKANPNPYIISIFNSLGACFEIASSGEFASCTAAGVPSEKLLCVGPGKTVDELNRYVESGVRAIGVESLRELLILGKMGNIKQKRIPIVLRVNPLEGKGKLVMAGSSQFGLTLELIGEAFEMIAKYEALDFMGYHFYLGTGILDVSDFLYNVDMIFTTIDTITAMGGDGFRFVDLGGGFGVPYTNNDPIPDWNEAAKPLQEKFETFLNCHPEVTSVAFESGRFLTAESGVFLTTVLDVKKVGNDYFVVVDGGTNVFPGFGGLSYGARPTPFRVLGSGGPKVENVTLCGPLCTPTDRLAHRVALPLPRSGQVVTFYQAGAYGYSAANGLFLSRGFPREAIFENGTYTLVRERLTAPIPAKV